MSQSCICQEIQIEVINVYERHLCTSRYIIEQKSDRIFSHELCSHHRLAAEDVGVVLIDELLHPLLPHLEHLGATVRQEGELLQHDVLGSPDLCSQVKLRGLWL